MADSSITSFRDAISRIGLSIDGLRLEAFRTDGTSNYLANLNYNGQTWAAALRMPARGAKIEDFLAEKQTALHVVQYLINILRGGHDIGNSCKLKFDGISYLVEANGVQNFLSSQTKEAPLSLIDNIQGREKRIEGFKYPESLSDDVRKYISEYSDYFYLSRGAPAWETLEEYTYLEEPVAHALAMLHKLTGTGNPVALDTALLVLQEVENKLRLEAANWVPAKDSKESRALEKSMIKWKMDNNPERGAIIRCERFFRASAGKKIYLASMKESLSKHNLGQIPLRSFIHGDCHGGNFILVKYMYETDHPEVMLDRVFLNEIFDRDPNLLDVAIQIDPHSRQIVHDYPAKLKMPSMVATRKQHYDIHLIDLDNGRGIDNGSKEIHLYDAISYAISISNLSSLFTTRIGASDVLRQYYDGIGG